MLSVSIGTYEVMMAKHDGIYFACPVCSQHIDAENTMADEQICCPNCGQQIFVPPASTLSTTGSRSSIGLRLLAGVFGGLILAAIGTNIISLLVGGFIPKESGSLISLLVPFAAFLLLWIGSVVFGIREQWASRTWRRLLISSACCSFALPLAVFVATAISASQAGDNGDHTGLMAALAAGGVVMVISAIVGFFMGAILLTIGLLVGRTRKPSGN